MRIICISVLLFNNFLSIQQKLNFTKIAKICKCKLAVHQNEKVIQYMNGEFQTEELRKLAILHGTN